MSVKCFNWKMNESVQVRLPQRFRSSHFYKPLLYTYVGEALTLISNAEKKQHLAL